jgi:hypothetical protein
LTREWVTETTVLAVAGVKPQCEVGVFEVKKHAKVARENHFGDELDVIHPKSGLPLEIVEFPIIGTEAECAVLFRDGENWRFEVAKSQTCGATAMQCDLALTIIKHDMRTPSEHGYATFAWPWAHPKGGAFPCWGGGQEGLVAIMLRGGFDGVTIL